MAKKQYGDPVVRFRLKPVVIAQVKAFAEESDITFSDVVRSALAQYLENQQQKTPAA